MVFFSLVASAFDGGDMTPDALELRILCGAPCVSQSWYFMSTPDVLVPFPLRVSTPDVLVRPCSTASCCSMTTQFLGLASYTGGGRLGIGGVTIALEVAVMAMLTAGGGSGIADSKVQGQTGPCGEGNAVAVSKPIEDTHLSLEMHFEGQNTPILRHSS